MTAVAEPKTQFRRQFDQLDRSPAGTTYATLRRQARARFDALPLPGPRSEDWRFTSLAPLWQGAFELPVEGTIPITQAALPPSAPEAVRLVFVNGQYQAARSSVANLPAGVQVGSLADAPANVQHALAQVADTQEVFTALNTGLFHDGAYLLLDAGKMLDRPVEIFYLTQAGGQALATYPRTLIVAGKGSQATVVERYQGEGQYFTNAVTEVSLAEGAIVDHIKVQQESAPAYHIANLQVLQAGRSTFTTHYLSLGGRLVRHEARVRFDGEHSEATVNGLYLAAGQQHMDNLTVIDHARPNCASHELYKGILDDQAHGVFNGKIFVRPDAQKTDAKQTNKVLLLSEGATINTKPQLEIFADDVKCTHGATVGQLDPNQLFYLQSRGIDPAAGRRLLTFAFANDLLRRIKIEAIRDELEALIVRRELTPDSKKS